MLFLALLVAVALAANDCTSGGCVDSLAELQGKTVFLKFFAPWCGHCKTMAPVWAELMEEYKDSPTTLIAKVDCTAGGKDLCTSLGVQGYPTLMYGDPNDLQKYEGGRDLAAFKEFAAENLGPVCGPSNKDLCDEKQQKKLAKFENMSLKDLEKLVKKKEGKIAKDEQDLQDLKDKCQRKITLKEKKTKKSIAKIKKSGLGLAKSVLADRSAPVEEEGEEDSEEEGEEDSEEEEKDEL